jgi:hypothetical protein
MKATIFPTHTSLAAMKTARHGDWPAAGGDAVVRPQLNPRLTSPTPSHHNPRLSN